MRQETPREKLRRELFQKVEAGEMTEDDVKSQLLPWGLRPEREREREIIFETLGQRLIQL